MPLLKIWNSIRGRSPAIAEPPATAEATVVESTPKSVERTARGGRLSLFSGGAGTTTAGHAGLRKLVKPLAARSVLEISVGDGSRAVAVLQSLGNASDIRYVAIDQFEMAGGAVTLKTFHQTMRAAGIRPQVFPEPLARGLIRVAHTVGAVDLVIIAAAMESWRTPEILSLLTKVSHPSTTVLYEHEGSWQRFDSAAGVADERRAA
jgi:hypothetical protein